MHLFSEGVMRRHWILGSVVAAGLMGAAAGAGAAEPAGGAVDETEVARKIAALGVEDETVPYDRRPEVWLFQRRERILRQLIAALDDRNPRVARVVLYNVLRDYPENGELIRALVARGGDDKSPVRGMALEQLEKYAGKAEVARVLEGASEDSGAGDELARAKWASLVGKKRRAVEILAPVFRAEQPPFNLEYAIKLLGEIGDASALPILEPVAGGERWDFASLAYLAMAKIDPAKHGLSKVQAAFLETSSHRFKESNEHRAARVRQAATDVKELRPFVMQMLRDANGGAADVALAVLAGWKDKEALPEIAKLLADRRSFLRGDAAAAYLAIDSGAEAEKVILNALAPRDEYANEGVLRGIASAEIPIERRLAILQAAAAKSNKAVRVGVTAALNVELAKKRDIAAPLKALMDAETYLGDLADYCGFAVSDKDKRFGPQVQRAVHLLATDGLRSADAEQEIDAAQRILDATAAYELKDASADVRKLAGSDNARIRAAAQATGARLGIEGMTEALLGQLSSADAGERERASAALLRFKPADERERAAREAAALAQVGKAGEDFALRLLSTCGGEASVKALTQLLDDADAERAVHAAWVLAQLPDKAAAMKGLRRVAIYGMFHHQMYQQGAGIDFQVAPAAYFHQVTQRLNPRAYAGGEAAMQIPKELLGAFPLEEAEVAFAIRSYRFARAYDNAYGMAIGWPMDPGALDNSYLPVLRVVAAEDDELRRLMVKGKVVPHFAWRQAAAKAIARITQEKATYVGLAGERIDSEASPEPYADQERLLVTFVVDRIEAAKLPVREGGMEWTARENRAAGTLNLLVRASVEAGTMYADGGRQEDQASLTDAIRAEAQRRGLDVKGIVADRRE